MANTTNFGWETPDDTDLVKDGAAAMRTLGNSIDASFVDLKGGTTGQILSKNSNTDLDYVWIDNDQGDITAVTAGTGISGGGTSGAVTITNSMATEITASGDIIVGTGSGTFDNLPIGTTGQVLTADTTVSPYKVKWASLSSGFVGCSIYASNSSQSFTSSVTSVLTYPSEDFDTDGFHSTSTNTSRITIPSGKAGKYLFNVVIAPGDTTPEYAILGLRKNNSGVVISAELKRDRNIGSNTWSLCGSMVYDAAVGDYFEVTLECNWTTGNKTINSRFTATYLGA